MSGTPELTVTVPCATCGGTETIYRSGRFDDTGEVFTSTRGCPDCTDGTVRVAVSCASCLWAERQGDFGDLVCTEPDHNGEGVMSTFGCLDWTAKEGTDGNG